MPVVLGPERDKTLKIDQASIEKRVKRNESLNKQLEGLAQFLAEGHGMAYGTHFETGSDLAYFLFETLRFSIAALMEQGYVGKKLPKKGKEDESDTQYGQYV